MDGAELLDSGLTALRLLGALIWLMAPGLLASLLILPAGAGLPGRLIWGFGSSVLLYSLGALLMDGTTGIGPLGWAALLVTATLTATLVARRLPEPEQRPPEAGDDDDAAAAPSHGGSALLRGVRSQLPALLTAALLAMLAFGMARSGLTQSAHPRTELWAETRDGRVLVNVLNQEGRPVTYRVEIGTPMAAAPLAVRHIDQLASGRLQQLDYDPAPDTQVLLVRLYLDDLHRDNRPRPYRHVSISLRPPAPPSLSPEPSRP